MNIFLTQVMTCPVCGVHLNWLPEVKDKNGVLERRKIEHPKLVGTEYCEYYGKIFLAPVLELKEVEKQKAAAAVAEVKDNG